MLRGRKRAMKVCISLAVAALGVTAASSAFAFTFAVESMDSWGGCESACSNNASLSNTYDQASYFSSTMRGGGHTRAWWYHNEIWASDVIEDTTWGGVDYLMADAYPIYMYSGHGSAPETAGKQRFQASLCRTGSASTCRMNSERMVIGEKSGTYATNKGYLRWLILATCHSVDTRPNEQWGQALYYGGDMVFGYRGTSADSFRTDEVPGDFAASAFVGGAQLKAAWFSAIEDFFVDDVGSVITSGATESEALWRRDNLTKQMSRGTGVVFGWTAWSWHEG
jgi:hypothetical protein